MTDQAITLEARDRETNELINAHIGDPDTDLIRFFRFGHLITDELKARSRPFAELAVLMCANLPPSAERTAGLRKLLEAKDCFVRCAVPR